MPAPLRPLLSLLVLLAASLLAPTPAGAQPFDQNFSLHGISFRVTATEEPGQPTRLRITPKGLKGENTPIDLPVNGRVVGAEIADLNVDRSPEVYVYVRPPGEGAGITVLAWSANRRKSLSQITLGEIPAKDPRLQGYQGRDEYAVVESVLLRRFPVGNKMRQISYQLKAGEAGWILRPGRSTEF